MYPNRNPRLTPRIVRRCVDLLLVAMLAMFMGATLAQADEAPKAPSAPPPGAVEPPTFGYCFPSAHPRDRLNPQDYRSATAHWKGMVEGAHFESHYEAYLAGFMLVQGAHKHGEYVTAGFEYTLWGFPNHPRALAAIEQLSYRDHKTDQLPKMQFKVWCYFQRAVKWYPDDPMPHAIYAYYLARRDRRSEALFEIWRAEQLDPGTVDVSLYLAFAYIKLNEFEKAAVYAKKAYAQGYPLPWLRQRLAKEGIKLD